MKGFGDFGEWFRMFNIPLIVPLTNVNGTEYIR